MTGAISERYLVPLELVRAAAMATSWVFVVRQVLNGRELMPHGEVFRDDEGLKAEVYFKDDDGSAIVRLREESAAAAADPCLASVIR